MTTRLDVSVNSDFRKNFSDAMDRGTDALFNHRYEFRVQRERLPEGTDLEKVARGVRHYAKEQCEVVGNELVIKGAGTCDPVIEKWYTDGILRIARGELQVPDEE